MSWFRYMNGFKYLFKHFITYKMFTCYTYLQIGILIYIYIKHGNYLYTSYIPAHLIP